MKAPFERDTVAVIDPRSLIEAARNLARKSRDLAAPAVANLPLEIRAEFLRNRMEIVMDCYLTGCEEMLRRIHGDTEPEPWEENFDHEARLVDLFTRYGYLEASQ